VPHHGLSLVPFEASARANPANRRIDTVAVRDVQETGNVIRGIVACMKDS
jgi:hypothetical protein